MKTKTKDGFSPFKILAERRKRKVDLRANGFDEHGKPIPGRKQTPVKATQAKLKPSRKPTATTTHVSAATIAELREFPRQDAERYFRGFYTLAAARHEQRHLAL